MVISQRQLRGDFILLGILKKEQQVMYAKLTENHRNNEVVKGAHDYFLTTLYDARRIYDFEQKYESGNWVQKAINAIGIWSIKFSYFWHSSQQPPTLAGALGCKDEDVANALTSISTLSSYTLPIEDPKINWSNVMSGAIRRNVENAVKRIGASSRQETFSARLGLGLARVASAGSNINPLITERERAASQKRVRKAEQRVETGKLSERLAQAAQGTGIPEYLDERATASAQGKAVMDTLKAKCGEMPSFQSWSSPPSSSQRSAGASPVIQAMRKKYRGDSGGRRP